MEARRAKWGFSHQHPVLAFKFLRTTARDGRMITLRASPNRSGADRLVVNRNGREHEIQWIGDADTFDAYVNGDYEVEGI